MVKRYEYWGYDSWVEEDPEGPLIKVEDYQALYDYAVELAERHDDEFGGDKKVTECSERFSISKATV